ncbi:putative zinc ribbon protein [Klebsiella quasipneumoniae]
MRILKCFLANNIYNKYVTAKEAAGASNTNKHWTCASCGCRLILHKGDEKEGPWFEHIQHSISHHKLMKCPWVDPMEKEAAVLKNCGRSLMRSIPRPARLTCSPLINTPRC